MFNGYWFVFFVGLEYLARKNILYMYLFDLSILVYSFKKQQLEIAQMCMLPSFKCQQKYFKNLVSHASWIQSPETFKKAGQNFVKRYCAIDCAKGQLISKYTFGVIILTKILTFF